MKEIGAALSSGVLGLPRPGAIRGGSEAREDSIGPTRAVPSGLAATGGLKEGSNLEKMGISDHFGMWFAIVRFPMVG